LLGRRYLQVIYVFITFTNFISLLDFFSPHYVEGWEEDGVWGWRGVGERDSDVGKPG
jgi:hypothetical protein